MRNTSPSAVGQDAVLHDARAVHDSAALPVVLETGGGESWTVLSIKPAPGSGAAEHPGTAVDVRTGGVIDTATGRPAAAEAPLAVSKSGRWESVAALGGAAMPRQGGYGWHEPLKRNKMALEPEDLYCPFAKGGTVLCCHHPGAGGAAEFAPVFLLPEAWVNAVAPVYDWLAANRRWLTDEATLEVRAGLLQILTGPNPVLAALAWRRILETRDYDEHVLKIALSAQGFGLAVNLYLAATGPARDQIALRRQVSGAVEQSAAAGQRRFAAVGLLAVRLFRPDAEAKRPWLAKAMAGLRARGGADDPYLQQAFQLLGV